MKSLNATFRRIVGLFVCLSAIFPLRWQAATPGDHAAGTLPNRELPLFFIEPQGNAAGRLHPEFVVSTPHLKARFWPEGIQLGAPGYIWMRFEGANPDVVIEPLDTQPGRVSFLTGSDPQHWRTNLPAHRGLAYRKLYRGIDMLYHGEGRRLKSEFIVAPGADPTVIRIRYTGVQQVRIDSDGSLIVATGSEEFREAAPDLYQDVDGERRTVTGSFSLLPDGAVGFEVGMYDHSRLLVIDPLIYSTYAGGSSEEAGTAIAADRDGNVYVGGWTLSTDLPTRDPLQARSGGGIDAFVFKLNAAGNALVYATYFGGAGDDRAFGIAVDNSGSAYVTGWTGSADFPKAVPVQPVLAGGRDAFVLKLNAAGNALVYSTYLGGSSNDSGNAIAIDAAGNAYVAGETYSPNFPVLSAAQSAFGGARDAFVAKLNATGTQILFSTYTGGYGDDRATGIAVDSTGSSYVSGATSSPNFPLVNAFQTARRGAWDGFVAKLSPTGNAFSYATLLGGGSDDYANAIAVDAARCAYVTGSTSSYDFPVANTMQAVYAGGTADAFLTKLSSSGSTLIYSTFLGGTGPDQGNGIAVDAKGAAVIAGQTFSTDFPVDPLQSRNHGSYDAFVARFNASGSGLVQSTYFGGADSDTAAAVTLDSGGACYITGQTMSADLPIIGGIQAINVGGRGVFVANLGTVAASRLAPIAAFRDNQGGLRLMTYGAADLKNGAGVYVGNPAVAVDTAGDVFTVVRNAQNQEWLRIFYSETQSFSPWLLAGGNMTGDPAVTISGDGTAYIFARDASANYWMTTYRDHEGFSTWTAIGSAFSSDPVAATTHDGTVHIVGRDTAGKFWEGRILPGGEFSGWRFTQGVGTGKPSVAAGPNATLYIVALDPARAVWLARVGPAGLSWFFANGLLGTDPDLGVTSDAVYVTGSDPGGDVWVRRFTISDAQWSAWSRIGTLLQPSSAVFGNRFYISGRERSNGTLWWYEHEGAGWTKPPLAMTAASDAVVMPK